eukprot:gene10273-7295_t
MRQRRDVTVDPATPITPIVVPDTSDLTLDASPTSTPQSAAPATTPGTHRSGVSLHFDALYPDVIAAGEDIDFYLPEPSSLDHSPTATKLSTSADTSSVLSLQDVYQHARSPLVAGEAPFFQLQSTPGGCVMDAIPDSGEPQRLDLSDDELELELDDVETLPVATRVDAAHATAAPAACAAIAGVDGSDGNDSSDSSDSAWVNAFHRHVLAPWLPAEPPSWAALVDATTSSATVDAAMERLFPEDVVRAFFPAAVPALLVELAVLLPRGALVLALLVARLVHALAVRGLRVSVACGLWPWRCVEAAWRAVLRAAVARCQSTASRVSFASPVTSSATTAAATAAVLL